MKKIILLILIIFIIFNLNGCGKVDVDQLATTTAIGLDKTEEGNFKLSVQVLNANAMGNNPKDVSPIMVYSEEARTIQEALRKMTTFFTHRLFFSHFQIILIGEELAKDGIEPYLNFLNINTESLHTYNIILVQGDTAENVLKIQTATSYVSSKAIEGKVRAALKFYGNSIETNMDEVMYSINTDGLGLTLASMIIIGDVEEGKKLDNTKASDFSALVKVGHIGVFKNDKLVGWLNERESIGLNYINDHIDSSPITVTLNDGSIVSVEIQKPKAKRKVEIIDNKPKIKINLKTSGVVTEDLSGQTKYTAEYVDEIQKKVSYEIKTLMEESIKKAQEYNSDIFGFCNTIHRSEPKFWKTIKDDYDTIFSNIEVEINISTIVFRVMP